MNGIEPKNSPERQRRLDALHIISYEEQKKEMREWRKSLPTKLRAFSHVALFL